MIDTVELTDSVGDIYVVPSYYKDVFQEFDRLVSKTAGDFPIHEPLVGAWVEIFDRYRISED